MAGRDRGLGRGEAASPPPRGFLPPPPPPPNTRPGGAGGSRRAPTGRRRRPWPRITGTRRRRAADSGQRPRHGPDEEDQAAAVDDAAGGPGPRAPPGRAPRRRARQRHRGDGGRGAHGLGRRERPGVGDVVGRGGVARAGPPAPPPRPQDLLRGPEQAPVAAGRHPPARGLPGAADAAQPPLRAAPQPPPPPRLPVGDRLRQAGDLRQTGQTGRGHLRDGVQGPQQADGEPGSAEGDPAGARGGGSLHRHPRGVAAQGPEARQHRDAARHHPHRDLAHPRLRVPGQGPEAVPGRLRQRHQHAQREALPLPAAAGFGLLPPAQGAAPRPQAPEPAAQRPRRAQTGRFRAGAGQVDPHQDVLERGGDALVPAPRHPPGLHRVLDADRHVGRGLHLLRDVDGAAALPGLHRRGAAALHLPPPRDPHGGDVAGHPGQRGVSGPQVPALPPRGAAAPRAPAGQRRRRPAGEAAAVRGAAAHLGGGGHAAPLLRQPRPPRRLPARQRSSCRRRRGCARPRCPTPVLPRFGCSTPNFSSRPALGASLRPGPLLRPRCCPPKILGGVPEL